ncbi:MAG TPA: LuxR C-terminal-related transcriptional regulator [Negativicutes bacterium]|nr:LuxR C-terminal-related transcriptional regulator [Negativicutes bacterium]
MLSQNSRQLYTRKALNQSLQGIWQHQLTVVEAPMGYGKTTAVREFLRDSQAQVLWQTVFESSTASFWCGFSRLFAGIDQDCAQHLAALGVPGDSVFREEAVELLGNVKFTAPTAIVIDDYHLLAAAAVDRFFERLARSVIPNMHLVIVSRTKYGGNTAELALKGHCLVIGRKDFELSSAETVDYCRLCGVRLKSGEAAFLEEYAAGWISAVYLCILGYRQTGRLERQPSSLHELLERVVYQPCPEELKEFLATICIYDSFSLAQAAHIWRRGNAGDLLTQLMAQNAFITFDQANGLYSLHNILTGYLRRLFDRQDLTRRQELWKLAGEWYLSAGDYNHAMDYFYKAGDFERLMSTIEIGSIPSFARQPREMRLAYFRECPPAIKERHLWAGLAFYYTLMLYNDTALGETQCREVAGLIDNSPWPDGATRLKLKGALEFLKGGSCYNDLPAMVRHYQAAWDLLQAPLAISSTKEACTLGNPSFLYMYYRECGGLAATVRTMKEGMPVYNRVIDNQAAGGEHLMEAEHLYYTGDFENAEIVAHRALHIAASHQEATIVLCTNLLLIRLALVRGDWPYAQLGLQRLREMIKQQSLYTYIYTLDMGEGLIFACLNQLERIPAWLANGELPENLYYCCHAFCHIIRAKALLLGGRCRELIGIAGQLADAAAFFPNLLALIYIRICEAAALDRLGRRQEALAVLAKAVDIAAPDQVVMPFVENSGHIGGLLAELQTAGRRRDFIARIRDLAPPVAARWQEITATLGEAGGRPGLTAREAEIAALVAAGLSNPAIGRQLNIAEDTVKKTLKKIYAKLGIGSRTALTRIVTEQRKS